MDNDETRSEPRTVIGNLGNKPELRFTPTGKGVANCTLYENRRTADGQIRTVKYDVEVWNNNGTAAENAAESYEKGDRVVAYGPVREEPWTTQDGRSGTKLVLNAWELASSTRFNTVTPTRIERYLEDRGAGVRDVRDSAGQGGIGI